MALRSAGDRVRQAVLFELLGLVMVVPGGAWVFDLPTANMGVAGVAGATIATLWNFVYNLGFDRAMLRYCGHTHKTVRLRVFHSLLFEGGLLVILLPPAAWYLGVSLWEAFVMDIAFVVFYVIYAFFFNLAYDRLFPVPEAAVVAK